MDVHEKLQKINTMIFDVDGVFTDGSLLVTEQGELLRIMDAKDGYAVKRAVLNGFRIVIITGGDSNGVKIRFNKLGVTDVFMEISDKLKKYNEFISENNILHESVLYMGDDILDIELMQNVFLAACPKDACHEALEIADFISDSNGGKGCVREIIEKVLSSQDKWH
jgi:3-deoxy-D-manno-octulosonate 8-phosphate phosphatase (KDO 8-P phosphatase)